MTPYKRAKILFTFQIRCPFHLCPVQSINYLINPLLHPNSSNLNSQNTERFISLKPKRQARNILNQSSPSQDCKNQLDQHPLRQISSNWTKVCKQHQYCSPCYLQSTQTTMSIKDKQTEFTPFQINLLKKKQLGSVQTNLEWNLL